MIPKEPQTIWQKFKFQITKCEKLPFELLVRRIQETPKTTWVIALALHFLPEIEGVSLLLKIPGTWKSSVRACLLEIPRSFSHGTSTIWLPQQDLNNINRHGRRNSQCWSVDRGFCLTGSHSRSVPKKHTEAYINYKQVSLLFQASF